MFLLNGSSLGRFFFSLNVPGGSFIIFSSHDDDVKNVMCVSEIVCKSVCE